MLTTLAVENYRSLRRLVLPLQRLTVVTGGNGTGKSSLYRALRLLAGASRNGAVAALAREGGLPSTLWAGPESLGRAVRDGSSPIQGTVRKERVSLKVGFAGTDVGYAMDLGLPIRTDSAFHLDPEIKRECVWGGPVLRPSTLFADRSAGVVRLRGTDGSWQLATAALAPFDSMISEIADPRICPELLDLRDALRSWRFYDQVRTDALAPSRSVQVGTRTPVLDPDGSGLAAALQTIREIGDSAALDAAIECAFAGSTVDVINANGRFELAFHQHGLLRPLSAAEISDGTLRYLLWVAALLTPRPPALFVLNEPETSLHPDLLSPLAELIVDASGRTQVVTVTHSQPLVSAMTDAAAAAGTPTQALELTKEFGQTRLVDQDLLDAPAWTWPKR